MNMNLQYFGGRGSSGGKGTESRTAAESISKPANATITEKPASSERKAPSGNKNRKQQTTASSKSYKPTLREFESAPAGTVYITEKGSAYVKQAGFPVRFTGTTADGRTLSGLDPRQMEKFVSSKTTVTRTTTTAKGPMGDFVYAPNETARRKRRGY